MSNHDRKSRSARPFHFHETGVQMSSRSSDLTLEDPSPISLASDAESDRPVANKLCPGKMTVVSHVRRGKL